MITERQLTDGAIALRNLGDQIDALEPEVRLGRATIETRAGLVELIALRGLIVGRIADYFRAEEIAEQLERAPSSTSLTMLWPTWIVPYGSRSMSRRPMASGRRSSRPSAATMKPLSCVRKPQHAAQALRM
jgi:hypothetical protein